MNAEPAVTASRWIQLGPLVRGPSGRFLCRMCGVETKPPRQTFCSAECVEEWKIRSGAGFVRARLRKRDHGICALCGLDALALEEQVEAIFRELHANERAVARTLGRTVDLDVMGQRRAVPLDRTLWEADHIVPVVEGGGQCGLEGYRTLCRWCHAAETAALAARRAAARRPQTVLPFAPAGGRR